VVTLRRLVFAAGFLALGAGGYASQQAGGEAAVAIQVARPTPTPLWGGLLDDDPVGVAAPLPPPESTALDDAYVRRLESPPQWWSCLRCADYRPSGGTWRLLLDRGILRIVYDVTQWRNLASYEIHGEELRVFNDPICPWDDGIYRWAKDAGHLRLQVVEDECAFGLRAENLGAGDWLSCRPPDSRAAASDAWSKPAGCAPARVAPPLGSPSATVTIYSGDARQAVSPPTWIAAANVDNLVSPDGIEIARAPEAVAYGLNVVLWEGGPWVEATVTRPTEAMGVQFWGPSTMGVARLLLDGEEVWRGEVATLGRYYQLFGGYLEISGYAPGEHTLRVEHLGADERPLTVLFFGGR
jgi:hypothetical protein